MEVYLANSPLEATSFPPRTRLGMNDATWCNTDLFAFWITAFETAAVGLCSFQLVRGKLWIISTSAGQNADRSSVCISANSCDCFYLRFLQSYQRYKQILTASPTRSGYTSKRCEVSNKDDEEQQKPTFIFRSNHSFSYHRWINVHTRCNKVHP